MLDVADELELYSVLCDLEESSIAHAYFREEDFGNELTAIAVMPSEEARVFTKRFKLAKLSSPERREKTASPLREVDLGQYQTGEQPEDKVDVKVNGKRR